MSLARNAAVTAVHSRPVAFTDAEDKMFATLAARFALGGFALNRTTAGDGSVPFYVSRWGFIKPMHSLDEAQQFLKQVQGAKA